MGLFSSKVSQVVIPLDTSLTKPVDVAELERISQGIERAIYSCDQDREVIRSKYDSDPNKIQLSSCTATFKYGGNHQQTFDLLKQRFQHRTRAFELKIKAYTDPYDDDCRYGQSTVFFYEQSTIKVVV